jgi:predicted enzyme related to lactoylglutathione lyase
MRARCLRPDGGALGPGPSRWRQDEQCRVEHREHRSYAAGADRRVRAKEFYSSLGWRLDADRAHGEEFRIVQFTPPGSGCSIQFGTNTTSTAPGSAESLYLVVADIEAARDELLGRGVEVSEVFHEGEPGSRFHDSGRASGPAPERSTYGSFAAFSDPDGNGWLLQEITTRLLGR